MAYLQEKNGWYHIRWRDAAGKQHSQALKTQDEDEAKALLRRYTDEHKKGRGLCPEVSVSSPSRLAPV